MYRKSAQAGLWNLVRECTFSDFSEDQNSGGAVEHSVIEAYIASSAVCRLGVGMLGSGVLVADNLE